MDDNKDKAALASQSQAAQPTESKITDGDSARSFVAEWHREHFPTDRTFTNYIMGRNRHCALAGDFAWQLAKALESMDAAHIAGTSQATKAQADDDLAAKLNAAVDAEYPVPDSPHTSVIQRAVDNRAAMWRGINAARSILAAPVAKEAPQPESWLAYIDPECESVQDKRLSTVSGFVAGQAFDEICRLLGGRWPDCKMQEEAPKAHRFFMELFGAAPVASVAKEAEKEQQAHVMPPFAAPAGQHNADERAFDTLHGAVMNIPPRRADSEFMNAEHRMLYKNGHRDARHAAAELVAEAASRFRAQGGSTNTNDSGSDLAPTTSTVSTPTVQAEQIECWSRDEEDFAARSLDELLSNHDDLKPGDTVWVGDAVHPDPANLVNEDGIIENIGEAAYDIAGEHAEDYPEVTNEQAKELETLVTDWIKRTCPPNFWTVENVKPYVLSHEDFPNDRRPVQLAEPDSLRATSTDQANADGSAE